MTTTDTTKAERRRTMARPEVRARILKTILEFRRERKGYGAIAKEISVSGVKISRAYVQQVLKKHREHSQTNDEIL